MFLVFLMLLVLSPLAHAERYPPDANVVDVTAFGAIPNDAIDDTAAFEAARDKSLGHILFVPRGRYILTRPIEGKVLRAQTPGGPLVPAGFAGFTIQGEGMGLTTLAVPAGTPVFSDANAPRALFYFCSDAGGGKPNFASNCPGPAAPRNNLSDLTIRYGDNPGFVCADWIASNRGMIDHVACVPEVPGNRCYAGLWLHRNYPGPGLVDGVKLLGCQHAVSHGSLQYSTTFRDVTIGQQTVSGFELGPDSITIENLISNNTVPAVRMLSGTGQLVLIGGNLAGGSPGKSAIEVGASVNAYVRDVTAGSGYQSAIKDGAVVVVGSSVTEWFGGTPRSLFADAPIGSLRLPMPREPAAFYTEDWSQWANIRTYGGKPDDGLDDSPALQAAMDSGKPIIYTPAVVVGNGNSPGRYNWGGTVNVPCTTKRIIFMERTHGATSAFPPGGTFLRLASGCPSTTVLTIEKGWGSGALGAAPGGGIWIEHRDARTVVLRKMQLGGINTGYKSVTGAGHVYGLDLFMARFEMKDTVGIFHQLNTENVVTGNYNIADHARLSVVGWKTEGMSQSGPALVVKKKARVEILGGLLMPGVGNTTKPAKCVRIEDSDFFGIWRDWGSTSTSGSESCQVEVEECRGAECRQVLYNELPHSGAEAWILPGYLGRGANPVAAP
jgi:hypothetical protein